MNWPTLEFLFYVAGGCILAVVLVAVMAYLAGK